MVPCRHKASVSDENIQVNRERRISIKSSHYKSYDDLPLFFKVNLVAQVLGVSISTTYEVEHAPGFPILRVGSRMVVPKEECIQWMEAHTGGVI